MGFLKRLKELEKKVDASAEQVYKLKYENRQLKFRIDNPPKYNKGDKVNGYLIIDRNVNHNAFNFGLNCNLGYDFYWLYKCADIKTGEAKVLSQNDLDNQSKPKKQQSS